MALARIYLDTRLSFIDCAFVLSILLHMNYPFLDIRKSDNCLKTGNLSEVSRAPWGWGV
jgi:hypothetical protein